MRQHMEKMLKYRTRVFVDSETESKQLHGSLTSQDVPREASSQDFLSLPVQNFKGKIL